LPTARRALLTRDVSKMRPVLRQLRGPGRFLPLHRAGGLDELLVGGFSPGVGSYVSVFTGRRGAMVTRGVA
jgi:hypothetical protein